MVPCELTHALQSSSWRGATRFLGLSAQQVSSHALLQMQTDDLCTLVIDVFFMRPIEQVHSWSFGACAVIWLGKAATLRI